MADFNLEQYRVNPSKKKDSNDFNLEQYRVEPKNSRYNLNENINQSAHPLNDNDVMELIKQQHPGIPNILVKAGYPIAKWMAQHPVNQKETSSIETALRSAIRSPLEMAENLASKVGLPVNSNTKFPGAIERKEADINHPLAELAGAIGGSIPLGGGTLMAARTIPALSKFAAKASPSLLKRAALHGAEGAALGATYSRPGEEGRDALYGALLGGLIGGPGVSLLRNAKTYPNRLSNLFNMENIEKEYKGAEQASEQSALQKQQLENEIDLSHDAKTPHALLKQQNKANLRMKELEPDLVIPEKDTSANYPIEPHERYLVEKSEKLKNAENNISNYLDRKATHDVNITKRANEALEKNSEEIGGIYNKLNSDLSEKNITLSNSREAKEVMADIRQEISRGGFDSNEIKALHDELENIGKSKEINAKGLLDNYRTLDRLASDAQASAFDEGITRDEHNARIEKSKEYYNQAEKLKTILENGVGKEYQNKLKEANFRWATEVIPLRSNTTYNQMRYKKLIKSKNIIQDVRGEGPGQEILSNVFKNDEEIIKNLFGQKYSNKPHGLLDLNNEELSFLEHSPKLQNLIKNLEESVSEHEHATSRHKQALEQKKLFDENKKIEIQIQKQRADAVNEEKKLKEMIKSKDDAIMRLNEVIKSHNSTLEQKLNASFKLESVKKDRERILTSLKWASGVITSGYLGKQIFGNNNK